MNLASPQLDPQNLQKGRGWLWTIFALLISAAAITNQSLWNDEALTAIKAMQPSLGDWWHAMLADKASDLQMPLYMIYVWAWAKIFGVSELALRAANIPWFVGGAVTFFAALPDGKKYTLAAVALFSPFAWYYLSEARPYIMQLGASLMIVAAIYRLHLNLGGRKWFAILCLGLIALSGSSLLGMIWAAAACLATLVLLSAPRLFELARLHRIISFSTILLLAACGCYYLWTLKIGARASDVGRTDARNFVFIIYELLGFGGLGPGRLEIREAGLHAFAPFKIPLLLYALLIGDLFIVGLAHARRSEPRSKLPALAFAIAMPAIVILAAGFFKEFRVLGRHFMPLLPVLWVPLCLGLQERWSRFGWVSRPIAAGFMILSLASCLSFRFAARHKRDDYRDAAFYANSALQSGQTVWWNAGVEGAIYYHVPIAQSPGQKSTALWLMNPAPKLLETVPSADLIIMSKPDVYDGNSAVTQFVAQRAYSNTLTLPAFTLWTRKSGP